MSSQTAFVYLVLVDPKISRWLYQFNFLPGMHENSSCSTSLPTHNIFCPFNFKRHSGLICIFIIRDEIDYFFDVCVLLTQISCVLNCLFKKTSTFICIRETVSY